MDDDTSMTTLILWNISKALQRNPHLDLKLAIMNVHERLGNTRDVNQIMTHSTEERHLACALLAWHELGNSTAESLYDFIDDKFGDQVRDKGEQTDDTKTKPTERPDEPKRNQINKDSEKVHHPKWGTSSKSNEKSLEITDKPEHTQTIKISNIEHKGIESFHQPKCGHMDNKGCRFYPAKVYKTEVTQGNYGKFCCNIYREEVTNNNFCSGSGSKCKKDSKEQATSKYPFVATSSKPVQFTNIEDSGSREDLNTCSHRGPVVTLPPETKVVMRYDQIQSPCARHQGKKPREQEKDVMSKIDAACCMDSACAERLAELDKSTTELRNRAARLARREAERVELLERAEAAWRDLELGYQRRLNLAEEKECDLIKQAKKLLEERNGYKAACLNLTKLLKERGDLTEQKREELVKVEKEMCALACTRMRLSEEVTRSEATVTEHHIKVSQLDRDLQFKEDEKRRKLQIIKSEVESVRALAVEAERAMRAELSALRQQVDNVSKQLLREDDENIKVKAELDSLIDEKSGLVQDLEGCQAACDVRMQKKLDELKKARERLNQLKEKVVECQCKIPMDAAIEVQRTPSLAALCACSPEDRLLESCSCTSLRSQLLYNLLTDLFGGLQAELGDVGLQMPCQLLKCLEDKHNWDKGSVVKTNLRTFFSQLLIGELDIAIATSIEKYHARWVGASCADTLRMIPGPSQAILDDWQQVQERAIERRAQKLANKLAEQLFQERADQLVQRARDAVKADPPLCECKETAVFPCLVKPPTVIGGEGFTDLIKGDISMYCRRALKDVTQLRVQIEDLKKASLKIEDLKLMEENINKLVQRTSEPEPPNMVRENNLEVRGVPECSNNKDMKSQHQSVNTEESSKFPVKLSRSIRKKHVEVDSSYKRNTKKMFDGKQERLNKNIKKVGLIQGYTVNTCFCENQSMMAKEISTNRSHKLNADSEEKSKTKQIFSTNAPEITGPKQTKPISGQLVSTTPVFENIKTLTQSSCRNGCVCFHKIPSNTSIDKLLEKLTKWKCDLTQTSQQSIKNDVSTAVEDFYNPKHNSESKKSENSTQSKIPNQASGVEISNIKFNQNKSMEMNNLTNMLPNATNSEYLGAVNLEKNNDHCDCIVKTQKIKKLKRNKNEPTTKVSPFKCVNSELCECKNTVESKNHISNFHNKISWQEFSKKNTSDNDFMLKSQSMKRNSKLPNLDLVTNPTNKVENKNFKNKTDAMVNRTVKTSDLPCDCDYYIKLLGVTLANISSHKVFDDKLSISDRKYKTETTVDINKQGTTKQSPIAKSDKNSLNIQCQCHVKFDELKNYMENNFRKQWVVKDDKELDVQSFEQNISNDEEACVCCINRPMNDLDQLEVNTFYLLEEHLRGKLEELKKSCCQFSCLPAEEEEKVFSDILERVRKIISTNANEFTCKCTCQDSNQSDGSWKRADTLLQEYLKTKIQKVQCFCGNEDRQKECFLPKVLDEIYSLIEKDFQRLRNLCNYQDTNKFIKRDELEIPERDTNESNNGQENLCACKSNTLIDKDIDKLSKLNSNKSMILKKSMSAQVSHNHEMATKSIDVMEKGSKNVQTSESVKSVARKCFNSIEKENCGCDSMLQNSVYGAHEVLVNHHMTSMSNKEVSNYSKENNFKGPTLKAGDITYEQPCSSLKGYTVDCISKCAFGTCKCVNSGITGNDKPSQNIWTDLLKENNKQSQNISYIIDSISKKHQNEENGRAVETTNSNQTSENKESDYGDEEIALKYSKSNVVVSNNSANTCGIKFVDDYSPRPTERYHACDGCRASKRILKNRIRSESNLPDSSMMHKTLSLDCDCTMVPVCHVKMLVDNIENRLYHSKCTCDSFNPRVCPIHSKIDC